MLPVAFNTFPTPSMRARGWFPIGFSNEFDRPRRIPFHSKGDPDASALVAWRSTCDSVFVRHDVCPHLGSKLSHGTVLSNGCLQCPYHGVTCGPDSNHESTRAAVGKVVEHHNIVWWTSDASEDLPAECTDLTDCERRSDTTVSQWRMVVNASFSDCFRNGMDLHHAGWLHSTSFGNNVEEPAGMHSEWVNANELRVNFEYISNSLYKGMTGARTSNYHVFRRPSTTWNKVTSSNEQQFVFIHLAMRPITERRVEWYVTSASNYAPAWIPGPLREFALERITRQIAQREDARQLERMVSEDAKRAHAGHVNLMLDSVYDEWYEAVHEDADVVTTPMTGLSSAARAEYLRGEGYAKAALLESRFVSRDLRALLAERKADAQTKQYNAFIAERTRLVDCAIEAAVAAWGVETVVILKSGSDSRAYRMDCLRNVEVIEVDTAEVIDAKESIVESVGLRAARHTPVSNIRIPLDQYVRTLPVQGDRTLIVAEGVVYYLREEEVHSLLGSCAHFVGDVLTVRPRDMGDSFKFVSQDVSGLFEGRFEEHSATRIPGRFGTVVVSAHSARPGPGGNLV